MNGHLQLPLLIPMTAHYPTSKQRCREATVIGVRPDGLNRNDDRFIDGQSNYFSCDHFETVGGGSSGTIVIIFIT